MQGDINSQGTTVNINIYIQILYLCTSYIIAYHANYLELFYMTTFYFRFGCSCLPLLRIFTWSSYFLCDMTEQYFQCLQCFTQAKVQVLWKRHWFSFCFVVVCWFHQTNRNLKGELDYQAKLQQQAKIISGYFFVWFIFLVYDHLVALF